MNTGATHPLVVDYLARLGAESARLLPPDQVRELVEDVREHLAAALDPDSSEAEVREVLDRLGSASEVAAAAAPEGAPPVLVGYVPPPPKPPTFGGVEVGAIATLLLAEIVSVVWPLSIPLWITGVVLLLVSRLWTSGEKALGFAGLVTGFPVLLFSLSYATVGSSTSAELCTTAVAPGSNGQEAQTTCTHQGPSGTDGPVVWVLVVLALYALFQLYTIWRLARARQRVA
jgi:hypothetical protein